MRKTPGYWYSDKRDVRYYFLAPLSWMFCLLVFIRRFFYRINILSSKSLPVPVIVAGNITVGGSGKTSLVIWMANLLKENGYKPGLVSRGYGGKAGQWPQRVTMDIDHMVVGDEAIMLASRTECPMAVGPDRVAAIQSLLECSDVDVIISDDGLQHYAMYRDVEIAVVNGERRFGNGRYLPAGPLREGVSRLQEVDMIVVNGQGEQREYPMSLCNLSAVNMRTNETRKLSEFTNRKVHAVAGIGYPAFFFNGLKKYQIDVVEHEFPDHYQYNLQDLRFEEGAIVMMTEKDAVKCMRFANKFFWYVPVNVTLGNDFGQHLLMLLEKAIKRKGMMR